MIRNGGICRPCISIPPLFDTMNLSIQMDSSKHPLLKESCSEGLTLRIGQTLRTLLIQKAELTKKALNDVVREALAESVQPTYKPYQPPLKTVVPEPSRAKKALDAFNNPDVIHAIQSLATGIEAGNIQTDARSILEYFISCCPTQ